MRGLAIDVTPSSGTRIVCYCGDCQAFARFLDHPGTTDTFGGTDISQMAPSRMSITDGADQLRCVRLSDKGMFRWYAGCCRTPIGNTLGPRVPFVGLIHSFMDHAADGRTRDEALGSPIRVMGRSAKGGCPPNVHATGPASLWLRALRNLAGWWLTGKGSPSPFVDPATGAPRATPQVLSAEERSKLGD